MYYYSYTTSVVDTFDTAAAVGWLLFGVMVYGTWRLWRGMRPDAFERGLRALREQPHTTVLFPNRRESASSSTGRSLFQISLLPLMLLSCGLAMLLAQAQRPDDVSRPVTWALFVAVASWYGTSAWSSRRGVGPLRNHALAGVVSGTLVSAVLWGFYLGVDAAWGGISYERVTASVPGLLWWTAIGGLVGGIIGSVRAGRIYHQTRVEPPAIGGEAEREVAIQAAPRSQRARWSVLAMACAASLLFHLSATPHLMREVNYKYWVWDWHYHHQPHPGNMLTMTMPSATGVLPEVRDVDISLAINEPLAIYEPLNLTNYSAPPLDANPSKNGKFEVLVFTTDVPSGTTITRSMVAVTPSTAPPRVDVYLEPDKVVGQVAVGDFRRGQPIPFGTLAGKYTSTVRNRAQTKSAATADAATADAATADAGYEELVERLVSSEEEEILVKSPRARTRGGRQAPPVPTPNLPTYELTEGEVDAFTVSRRASPLEGATADEATGDDTASLDLAVVSGGIPADRTIVSGEIIPPTGQLPAQKQNFEDLTRLVALGSSSSKQPTTLTSDGDAPAQAVVQSVTEPVPYVGNIPKIPPDVSRNLRRPKARSATSAPESPAASGDALQELDELKGELAMPNGTPQTPNSGTIPPVRGPAPPQSGGPNAFPPSQPAPTVTPATKYFLKTFRSDPAPGPETIPRDELSNADLGLQADDRIVRITRLTDTATVEFYREEKLMYLTVKLDDLAKTVNILEAPVTGEPPQQDEAPRSRPALPFDKPPVIVE